MHDPMVVAVEIRRPFPRVSKMTPSMAAHYATPSFRGAFWRVAGYELYWPSLITIWHVEPDGHDAGTVCPPKSWRRHPHHWRIQIAPWQDLRRWAFDRCAWCGGRDRRGDRVNVSHNGWGGSSRPKHWWQSAVNVFHGDCSSIELAHRTCICSLTEGSWDRDGFSGPWGDCSTCGGFRRMRLDKDTEVGGDFDVHMRSTAMMRAIPRGGRDRAVTAEVERLWREHRASQPTEQEQ